ncbi:cation diffusion facilitator family transporter [Guptibacillus hwajinpoensis]|uniref:Cation transporter n=1 Tax=Guptibacillus hwajinpoensis TaxID=208199 RepID=A0A0J6FT72_9BACL|nr:cation diffusion facilitator family transporter [Alkalihalobacillus macyae]KMM37547.1 cation transporter [Alkalihalobacillus macyae]MDP4550416.1 cation diffusion facilitator family transporter [Alkalihalobacillus macyae]
MNKEERFRKAEVAAIVGILGNIVLAVLKGVIGYSANSRALIADAAHSASDVAGSFAVFVGLRAAKLPPDKDHPYGHGKAESIAAIIVAVLLLLVGVEIGISSGRAIFQPIEAPGTIALYAALVSIIVKEAMFRYKYRLGTKIKSDALIVNAYEHRSDVYSSIAVLIGIAGAILGSRFDLAWLIYADPIAGIFVSLLIGKMAIKLGFESIHNTLDHVLHEEDTIKYKQVIKAMDGVVNLDEFYAREHGHYVIIDIKLGVDPNISVKEGHDIGKAVKERLLEDDEVNDVLVHINPYEPKEK